MFFQIEKLSKICTAVILILLPAAIWGALSIRTGAAKVYDWLPEDRAERVAYERFKLLFGDDQFVLVTWLGCTLEDERLTTVEKNLRALNAEQLQPIFESVETTQTLLDRLTSDPIKLSPSAAKARLQGFVLGRDGTACILLELTAAGVSQGAGTLSNIYKAIEQAGGISRDEIYMAGTLFEQVAVDEASERSLRYLVPPSGLCAIVVAYLALGKLMASTLAFILAGIGQLIAFSLVYYTGGEFSAVLIVLPTLVFMLTLSASIHLVNYYGETRDHKHRGVKTLAISLKPTALASVTTMAGMASLAVSQLAPVGTFGWYSSISLGIATTVVLCIFPYLADLFLDRKSNGGNQEESQATSRSHLPFLRLTQLVSKHAYGWSLIAICLLLLVGLGVTKLTASTKFDKMFHSDAPTVQGLNWIEDHLGPSTSIEVVVTFDNYNGGLLHQLTWLSQVQKTISKDPQFTHTLSATDFLPPVPTRKGIRGTAVRAVYETKLRDRLDELHEQGWFAFDSAERNVWRITCKVTALKQSYGHFISELRNHIAFASQGSDAPQLNPRSIEITGLSPIAHEAQSALINDLSSSFLLAFVTITPVMILVVRSIQIGFLLMIPNVLPPTLVFGFAGWMGYHVDIASILTASVALGIAVDDTLHFVTWYQRDIKNGHTVEHAIHSAYRNCAIAMFETTLISCAAMLPFLFADFVPTQRFALLMIVMLSLALLGDLLILPALLIANARLFAGNPTQSTTANKQNDR